MGLLILLDAARRALEAADREAMSPDTKQALNYLRTALRLTEANEVAASETLNLVIEDRAGGPQAQLEVVYKAPDTYCQPVTCFEDPKSLGRSRRLLISVPSLIKALAQLEEGRP